MTMKDPLAAFPVHFVTAIPDDMGEAREVVITISLPGIRGMIRRALKNRAGECVAGPLKVKVRR